MICVTPIGAFWPCPGIVSNKNGCALAAGNPKKNIKTGIIQIFFNDFKSSYLQFKEMPLQKLYYLSKDNNVRIWIRHIEKIFSLT